jgi:rod shape-determining protein MreB
MAAIIGLELEVFDSRAHMVIDIGGGTTEIAVISAGGIVCNQSIKIAGNSITNSMIKYFHDEHNILISDNFAEFIKEDVGSAYPLDPEFEKGGIEIKGKDAIKGQPTIRKVSVVEIRDKAILPTVFKIIDAIRVLFRAVGPDVSQDILDSGI